MRERGTLRIVLLSAAALLLAGTALALDPDVKCESGKNKDAGKYAACLQKAVSFLVKKPSETVKYDEKVAKCDEKFLDKWANSETKGEGQCPDGIADPNTLADFITEHSDAVAVALAGGGLPGSGCQLPATGQTTCWQNAAPVPCAGTGHDGETRVGAILSFSDNGDGTITDNTTGLMWEKKSDDGSLHDWDDCYDWRGTCTGDGTTECWTDAQCSGVGGTCGATSCATGDPDDTVYEWLARVNAEGGTGFAGHADWRIPTAKELQSIANYENVGPAVASELDTACVPGCPVTSCSCTRSFRYWSSAALASNPASAWSVEFNLGSVSVTNKMTFAYVRAVRGGL